MNGVSDARQVRGPARPLVVTREPALEADLRRLAAAAGASLEVVAEASQARPCWQAAPVVLVGADMLAEVAGTGPTRRDRVHVVSRKTLPDGLFPTALAVGAASVVELPAGEAWLVETLTDTVDGASAPAVMVGVVGGCGGAGATTFATALAVTAASDVHPVTLVDADPLGAGIQGLAGLDDVTGAGWASLLESAGRLGSRSLREALPRRGGLAVLGWGTDERTQLDSPVVREVLSAAARGSTLVVVDLPRRDDLATTEMLLHCEHLVVVTTLTLPAVAATARLASSLASVVPRAHLVARGPASALDPGQVAEVLGVPLAAAMTDQRRLSEWVSLGRGPLPTRRGPLARAARSTLARVWSPARPVGAVLR